MQPAAQRVPASVEPFVLGFFLEDPELEVYRRIVDEEDSAFAVRSRRTGRWYRLLIHATTTHADVVIPEERFGTGGDLLVAAVVVGEDRIPEQVYLVRGAEWSEETALPACLARDHGGPGQPPFVGLRTSRPVDRAELELWYAAPQVVPTL